MTRFLSTLLLLTFIAFSYVSASDDRILTNTEVKPGSDGSSLVLLLHGYTLDGATLKPVHNALASLDDDSLPLAGADVLRPDMPLGTFSMARVSDITAELLLMVDQAWEAKRAQGQPYARLVLIGHSVGGLLARKIYAAANGEHHDAPFEPELKRRLERLGAASLETPRPWADKVDRIVLLAGMNNGWSIDHHMSIPRAATMQVGVGIGYILEAIVGELPIIFSIRRGSPFLSQLRLQWLAMRQQAHEFDGPGRLPGAALTVQLLGTNDDLVSPRDNVDSILGQDFCFLEVRFSGHGDVIAMDDEVEVGASTKGAARREALTAALARDLTTDDCLDVVAPLQRDARVTDVLFVIHGIRDQGFWTSRIALRTKELAEQQGRVFASETSGYGYFPMLSFLTPGKRQEKVAWLMERYAEAKARYPDADFHYVGHSHGTYLLAKALKDYPAVRFDRVAFAGSVVETDYDWSSIIPDRVGSVVNFVAAADWVVAFFPNAFEMIGFQDLGGAGHNGFVLNEEVELTNVGYVAGGHGAALNELMWDSIASYVVDGKRPATPGSLAVDDQLWWIKWLGKVAWVIPLLILTLVFFVLYRVYHSGMREWTKTLSIVAFLALVWTVLTEV